MGKFLFLILSTILTVDLGGTKYLSGLVSPPFFYSFISGCCLLSGAFSASEIIMFPMSSINIVYYINWFSDIKPI